MKVHTSCDKHLILRTNYLPFKGLIGVNTLNQLHFFMSSHAGCQII